MVQFQDLLVSDAEQCTCKVSICAIGIATDGYELVKIVKRDVEVCVFLVLLLILELGKSFEQTVLVVNLFNIVERVVLLCFNEGAQVHITRFDAYVFIRSNVCLRLVMLVFDEVVENRG